MRTAPLLVACLALGGCNFVLRDLLHVPLPMAEVAADKPHANVEVIVTHTNQISAHVEDRVRYADLHGGPAGVLPTPFSDSSENKPGWYSTLRTPVGDAYWLFETEFFHEVTTETCLVDRNNRTKSCRTTTERVRDAKCGAGGDFRFEDGHTYLFEYRFERHASCTLICTERRTVDGVAVTQPCPAPAKT